MTVEMVTKLRSIFETAGITKYTLEFNNAFSIHVGYEQNYAVFDDANSIVWIYCNKSSTSAWYDKDSVMEVRGYSYDEIQFIRAGVNMKQAMAVANASGCEVTKELTEVLKELCNPSGLYPIQSYPDKDDDGNAVLYGNMPYVHPGLE